MDIQKAIERIRAIAFNPYAVDEDVERVNKLVKKVMDERVSKVKNDDVDNVIRFWETYHALVTWMSHMEDHARDLDDMDRNCTALDVILDSVEGGEDKINVIRGFMEVHDRVKASGAGTVVTLRTHVPDDRVGESMVVMVVVDHEGTLSLYGQRLSRMAKDLSDVIEAMQNGRDPEIGGWPVAIELKGFCPPKHKESRKPEPSVSEVVFGKMLRHDGKFDA